MGALSLQRSTCCSTGDHFSENSRLSLPWGERLYLLLEAAALERPIDHFGEQKVFVTLGGWGSISVTGSILQSLLPACLSRSSGAIIILLNIHKHPWMATWCTVPYCHIMYRAILPHYVPCHTVPCHTAVPYCHIMYRALRPHYVPCHTATLCTVPYCHIMYHAMLHDFIIPFFLAASKGTATLLTEDPN